MSSYGSKAAAVKTPDDPDPTPMAQFGPEAETVSVARQERKRAASSYGRQQTILAGNSSADNNNKKTILGG